MTRLPAYVGAHVSGGVDRAPLNGAGIGFAVFAFSMQDKRFRGIPLVLETIDASIWSEEIQLLRRFSSETAASAGP